MNSLDKRVRKIESIVEGNDTETDLITKLKRKQTEKKGALLNELTVKYLEYLDNQSLSNNVDINLIEVLWYTIKYVELNKLSIGRLLEIKVTDDTFEDVVGHLININVPDVNEEFVCKGIKFLNSLQMKQEDILEVLQTKPKKSFFSKKNIS